VIAGPAERRAGTLIRGLGRLPVRTSRAKPQQPDAEIDLSRPFGRVPG